MNIINFFRNFFKRKVNSLIDKNDLVLSRYYIMYKSHKKRDYIEFLETKTIKDTNSIIIIFPNKIDKNIKNEYIDCVVLFLNSIHSKYDYFPKMSIYENNFERIITFNLKRIKEEKFPDI